jgi:DNA-binding Xre family transcriptional regulator
VVCGLGLRGVGLVAHLGGLFIPCAHIVQTFFGFIKVYFDYFLHYIVNYTTNSYDEVVVAISRVGGAKLPTIIGVKIVGKKLQRLRTKKLLSRKELADKTGLHPDHIGRLERSEATAAHMATIRRLTEALNVDPSELVDE